MTENPVKPEKLFVLWSSGDREVAKKMVFMYTLNAKLNGWWNDISLIVWVLLECLLHQWLQLILFV